MADVRTTIALNEDLLVGIKTQFRDLGFNRMADLVNQAIREYLQNCKVREKDRLMEEAARNPNYRRLMEQVSEDFRLLDAEGLGPDY